ncbi:MAG: carboxypeptidase regulatory-like domain-containing protein, partial [Bacteroidia bacterium]|nr:carboxypeptidase regulatory-like domain-containing protein [Bacteroidia bacterium]
MKHLLLGVFLLFGLHTYSQSWTFPVSGRVTNGGKKLDRANVTLFKSGTQVNQVVTSSNGKFEFVLEPDADYIITVTKPGFITKKFSFNTQNVPSDRAKQGFGGVDLSEIVIFEIPKGVDVNELNNILSQPIAKFAYQDAGKDFNYDENYTRSIRSKLDKLADVQKKAEEEDKKKSEGDKAITEKFNSVVSKADKAFTAKDYVAAKAAYNEALGLKPGESSIKSKLTEIDNLIA